MHKGGFDQLAQCRHFPFHVTRFVLTISYCQFHYVNLVLSLAFSLGSALHAKKWLQIATDSKAHVELMGTKIFFVDFWRRAEGAFVARLSRDPQKAICDVLAVM